MRSSANVRNSFHSFPLSFQFLISCHAFTLYERSASFMRSVIISLLFLYKSISSAISPPFHLISGPYIRTNEMKFNCLLPYCTRITQCVHIHSYGRVPRLGAHQQPKSKASRPSSCTRPQLVPRHPPTTPSTPFPRIQLSLYIPVHHIYSIQVNSCHYTCYTCIYSIQGAIFFLLH